MVNEQVPSRLITKVWAKNFRSIENAELELGPFTTLVGPNASGKSNLMDILRFVHDAYRKGIELAITDRGGINSVERRSSNSGTHDTEIGLQYRGHNGNRTNEIEYGFMLSRKNDNGYKIRREKFKMKSISLPKNIETLEIELNNGRLTKSIFTHQQDPGATSNALVESQNAEYSRWSLEDDFDDQNLMLISNQAAIRRGFLPLPVRFEKFERNYPDRSNIGQGITTGFTSFINYLHNMGFYRIFPNSLREPQKMMESNPLLGGGENLASALLGMVRRNNPFLPDVKQALNLIAPGIKDIKISPAGSFLVVELEHDNAGEPGNVTWFDLSDESDGTLRLLGLLVALFQQPPLTLFAIEEPEMNVHPGGMAVLMDAIAEASGRGQVLITTHSPDLVNLIPVQCVRAVSAESGTTKTGNVAEHQLQSVLDGLFSAGELHATEGLMVADTEN